MTQMKCHSFNAHKVPLLKSAHVQACVKLADDNLDYPKGELCCLSKSVKIGHGWVFQHDNDMKHKGRATKSVSVSVFSAFPASLQT